MHVIYCYATSTDIVILKISQQDYAEVSRLLSVENVDRGALMRYAQEAARFSTDARLPLRDFALNHYGEPDVALFDFTSMYAAENASMVSWLSLHFFKKLLSTTPTASTVREVNAIAM